MKAIVSGLALLLLAPSISAQITLVGPVMGRPINSLEDAGPKLYYYFTGDSVVLYNMDLTTYQQWVIPPDPPGFDKIGIGYITEDLFDADPSTIEYYVCYTDTIADPPVTNAMRIFRADGTQLFSVLNGLLFTTVGGIGQQETHPIFNTPSGTFMKVSGSFGWGGDLYQLPGHLPCPECDGTLVTGGGEQSSPGSDPHLFLFPNPSQESTVVQYELPEGTATGELVFFDVNGREVIRLAVNNSTDRVTVSTSTLSAGTYLYHLRTHAGVVQGPKLVVVR